MTPLEKVETLYLDLVVWYGEGADAETRAAAKLLMVGLAKLKEHGGKDWHVLAEDYLDLARRDPQRFQRVLASNRGGQSEPDDSSDASGRFMA